MNPPISTIGGGSPLDGFFLIPPQKTGLLTADIREFPMAAGWQLV
jgi:hypothetical protein